MKKTILFVVLIVMLVMAIPALAKGKEVVGERIDLSPQGDQTFPANQPFHIKHGIAFVPSEKDGIAEAHGQFDFKLEVDGQLIKEDFFDHFAYGNSPKVSPEDQMVMGFYVVYNFPEGMTDTHIFTGHWIWPCFAVYGEEACPDRMAPQDFSNEVEVTFD
jgi:hypothetical protein